MFPLCFALCVRHTTWLKLTIKFAPETSSVHNNAVRICLDFLRYLGECSRNPFKKVTVKVPP